MSGAREHERGVARFLYPPHRDRWLAYMHRSGDATRRRAVALLDHGMIWEERCATKVPPLDAEAERAWVAEELQRSGAGSTCHVMSTDPELDGRTMTLPEALAAVVGCSMGTVISCLPGSLAYYEGEDAGERYVLHR